MTTATQDINVTMVQNTPINVAFGTSVPVNVTMIGGGGSGSGGTGSGTSGTSGTSPPPTTSGTSPPQTTSGTSGVSGTSGTSPPQTTSGTSGTSGSQGSGYYGTSVTACTTGIGNRTFITNLGLAYVAGDRARAIAFSTAYIDGAVTAYTPTSGSLTINVDTTQGFGTYSSWSFGICGTGGTSGTSGISGTSGTSPPASTSGSSGTSGSSINWGSAYISDVSLNAYTSGTYGLDSTTNMQALYNLVVGMQGALITSGMGIILPNFTCGLSMVNGAAFITNPLISLLPYIGYKVTISDGINSAIGYIKAAGTGETYTTISSDPCSADLTANWTHGGTGNALAFSVDHYNITSNGGQCWAYKPNITVVTGALYTALFDIKNGTQSAGNVKTEFNDGNIDFLPASWTPTTGTSTTYQTYVTSTRSNSTSRYGIYIADYAGNNIQFKNFFNKQVLTPSATGVTIVSTQGGAVQNWASNSGLNPNSASYTITITAQ